METIIKFNSEKVKEECSLFDEEILSCNEEDDEYAEHIAGLYDDYLSEQVESYYSSMSRRGDEIKIDRMLQIIEMNKYDVKVYDKVFSYKTSKKELLDYIIGDPSDPFLEENPHEAKLFLLYFLECAVKEIEEEGVVSRNIRLLKAKLKQIK